MNSNEKPIDFPHKLEKLKWSLWFMTGTNWIDSSTHSKQIFAFDDGSFEAAC